LTGSGGRSVGIIRLRTTATEFVYRINWRICETVLCLQPKPSIFRNVVFSSFYNNGRMDKFEKLGNSECHTPTHRNSLKSTSYSRFCYFAARHQLLGEQLGIPVGDKGSELRSFKISSNHVCQTLTAQSHASVHCDPYHDVM
jgi:hypothetical protein